jgi:hypothetical protein
MIIRSTSVYTDLYYIHHTHSDNGSACIMAPGNDWMEDVQNPDGALYYPHTKHMLYGIYDSLRVNTTKDGSVVCDIVIEAYMDTIFPVIRVDAATFKVIASVYAVQTQVSDNITRGTSLADDIDWVVSAITDLQETHKDNADKQFVGIVRDCMSKYDAICERRKYATVNNSVQDSTFYHEKDPINQQQARDFFEYVAEVAPTYTSNDETLKGKASKFQWTVLTTRYGRECLVVCAQLLYMIRKRSIKFNDIDKTARLDAWIPYYYATNETDHTFEIYNWSKPVFIEPFVADFNQWKTHEPSAAAAIAANANLTKVHYVLQALSDAKQDPQAVVNVLNRVDSAKVLAATSKLLGEEPTDPGDKNGMIQRIRAMFASSNFNMDEQIKAYRINRKIMTENEYKNMLASPNKLNKYRFAWKVPDRNVMMEYVYDHAIKHSRGPSMSRQAKKEYLLCFPGDVLERAFIDVSNGKKYYGKTGFMLFFTHEQEQAFEAVYDKYNPSVESAPQGTFNWFQTQVAEIIANTMVSTNDNPKAVKDIDAVYQSILDTGVRNEVYDYYGIKPTQSSPRPNPCRKIYRWYQVLSILSEFTTTTSDGTEQRGIAAIDDTKITEPELKAMIKAGYKTGPSKKEKKSKTAIITWMVKHRYVKSAVNEPVLSVPKKASTGGSVIGSVIDAATATIGSIFNAFNTSKPPETPSATDPIAPPAKRKLHPFEQKINDVYEETVAKPTRIKHMKDAYAGTDDENKAWAQKHYGFSATSTTPGSNMYNRRHAELEILRMFSEQSTPSEEDFIKSLNETHITNEGIRALLSTYDISATKKELKDDMLKKLYNHLTGTDSSSARSGVGGDTPKRKVNSGPRSSTPETSSTTDPIATPAKRTLRPFEQKINDLYEGTSAKSTIIARMKDAYTKANGADKAWAQKHYGFSATSTSPGSNLYNRRHAELEIRLMFSEQSTPSEEEFLETLKNTFITNEGIRALLSTYNVSATKKEQKEELLKKLYNHLTGMESSSARSGVGHDTSKGKVKSGPRSSASEEDVLSDGFDSDDDTETDADNGNFQSVLTDFITSYNEHKKNGTALKKQAVDFTNKYLKLSTALQHSVSTYYGFDVNNIDAGKCIRVYLDYRKFVHDNGYSDMTDEDYTVVLNKTVITKDGLVALLKNEYNTTLSSSATRKDVVASLVDKRGSKLKMDEPPDTSLLPSTVVAFSDQIARDNLSSQRITDLYNQLPPELQKDIKLYYGLDKKTTAVGIDIANHFTAELYMQEHFMSRTLTLETFKAEFPLQRAQQILCYMFNHYDDHVQYGTKYKRPELLQKLYSILGTELPVSVNDDNDDDTIVVSEDEEDEESSDVEKNFVSGADNTDDEEEEDDDEEEEDDDEEEEENVVPRTKDFQPHQFRLTVQEFMDIMDTIADHDSNIDSNDDIQKLNTEFDRLSVNDQKRVFKLYPSAKDTKPPSAYFYQICCVIRDLKHPPRNDLDVAAYGKLLQSRTLYGPDELYAVLEDLCGFALPPTEDMDEKQLIFLAHLFTLQTIDAASIRQRVYIQQPIRMLLTTAYEASYTSLSAMQTEFAQHIRIFVPILFPLLEEYTGGEPIRTPDVLCSRLYNHITVTRTIYLFRSGRRMDQRTFKATILATNLSLSELKAAIGWLQLDPSINIDGNSRKSILSNVYEHINANPRRYTRCGDIVLLSSTEENLLKQCQDDMDANAFTRSTLQTLLRDRSDSLTRYVAKYVYRATADNRLFDTHYLSKDDLINRVLSVHAPTHNPKSSTPAETRPTLPAAVLGFIDGTTSLSDILNPGKRSGTTPGNGGTWFSNTTPRPRSPSHADTKRRGRIPRTRTTADTRLSNPDSILRAMKSRINDLKQSSRSKNTLQLSLDAILDTLTDLQQSLNTDNVTAAAHGLGDSRSNKNIMRAIQQLRDSIKNAAPDMDELNDHLKELSRLQTSNAEVNTDDLNTMKDQLDTMLLTIREEHQQLVETFTDAVQKSINTSSAKLTTTQYEELRTLLAKISRSPLVNADPATMQGSIKNVQESIRDAFNKQNTTMENGFKLISDRLDQRPSFVPARPGEDNSYITIDHIINGVAEFLAEHDIDQSGKSKNGWIRVLKGDSFATFYNLATSIKRVSDGHGWKHSLDIVREYLPTLRQNLLDAGVKVDAVDFESDTMEHIARELELYNS